MSTTVATILPLKRLPRGLALFDYTVPDELQDKLKTGQLVRVPLRSSEIFGLVVEEKKKKDTSGLKELVAIVQDEPLVSEQYLDTVQAIAAGHGVAPSTIALLGLLPLQKRKVTKMELAPLPKEKKKSGTITATHYSSFDERDTLIQSLTQGVTLVLTPEARAIEKILEQTKKQRVATWYSEMTTKEKFATWVGIRNGEFDLIVGTRGACLLPIPNLQTVIIDQEHHEQHKHWDQSPRFDARDVMRHRQQDDGFDLHLLDWSSSFSLYFETQKERILGRAPAPKKIPAAIVNLQNEYRGGNRTTISDPLFAAIKTSTKDIFLLVNRKGFSASTLCLTCGHSPTCPSCTLPLVHYKERGRFVCNHCHTSEPYRPLCPTCHTEMKPVGGAGTERVATDLIKRTDALSEVIHVVDGDHTPSFSSSSARRIIIGTTAALPHIRWDKTDLVACIDPDTILGIPDYTSQERLFHTIYALSFFDSTATLFIQTTKPDHLFYRSLQEPERLYRTDLRSRKALDYPPYGRVIRYTVGKQQADESMREATQIHRYLTTKLTQAGISATVSSPYRCHPSWHRGRHWSGILVKVAATTSYHDIAEIHSHIPKHWHIDITPQSILAP